MVVFISVSETLPHRGGSRGLTTSAKESESEFVSEKIIAFLLSYTCVCQPSRSASDL